MAQEIERKFFVKDMSVLKGLKGTKIVQGYLSSEGATVRVRIAGDKGFLTIKGKAKGLARDEYEYEIPAADAFEMLRKQCGDRIIKKTRYLVPVDDVTFEVDVFKGRHAGIVMAEVELQSEDQEIPKPLWLGREVTGDSRFSNRTMACAKKVRKLYLVAA